MVTQIGLADLVVRKWIEKDDQIIGLSGPVLLCLVSPGQNRTFEQVTFACIV